MSGVLVLGCPRSGTSAITRVLALLGLNLGTDLIGAGRNNPTGHWESGGLIYANRRILESVGSRWWCPPTQVTPNDVPSPLLDDSIKRFTATHRDQPWVAKDPRLCITMPVWERPLQPAAVVLVVRRPEEVVRSILTTWTFAPEHALALWERYTRAAVVHSGRHPAVVVDYGDLVDDPRACLASLRKLLESVGIEPSGPDVTGAVREFLDGRRPPPPSRGEALALTPQQDSLLGSLLAAALGPPPSVESLPPESEGTAASLLQLRHGLAEGLPIETRPRWVVESGDEAAS